MNLLQYLRRHGSDHKFEPAPPSCPTKAMPGSRDKVAIMAARLLAGEDIHHEQDERIQAPHWTRIIARESKMVEVPKELREYCDDYTDR